MHHDIPCHYCARSGRETILEHLPTKKEFYCKRCEYHWAEDTINAEQHKKAKTAPVKKTETVEVKAVEKEPVKVVKKEAIEVKKEEPKQHLWTSEKKEDHKKTRYTR